MDGGRRVRWCGTIALTLAVAAATIGRDTGVSSAASNAGARAIPIAAPGAGAPRPRILYAPGSEALLRARLTRDPYRAVFLQADARVRSYLANNTIGDPAIAPQRDLSRAAKQFAFEYALGRTVAGGQVVPFATAAARQAVGDQVRNLLYAMYDRSRMAVPAPLGGFDRDINTSEEIINYATAYDTLLGAGYDLGPARPEIVRRLHSVSGELYRNYVEPASANNAATLNQNNHRTKSGAAVAIAAVALGGDIPPSEGLAWWDWGSGEVDDILRYIMSPGDGGYAEGPFYYRYSMQNVLPFLAVWERFLGAQPWTTAGGLLLPAYAHDPVFVRAQQWMLDTTLPDGTMAPIDDSNPGRSYYFGTLPQSLPVPLRAAAAWRWPSTPQPLETDGSVELGPDTIVAYDDSITPSAPATAPTSAYPESGVAVLRSSWAADAMAVVVLGEHDTASEFGRDRTGRGRAPESHEHPDAGSFSLYAYGEPLALDPGYLTFTTHSLVNQPNDHNMVLVDGKGPIDPLVASLRWMPTPFARPPTDGQSTLHDVVDTEGVDSASVATRYGTAPITVARDVQTLADRFVVVVDDIATTDLVAHDLTWQLHGNGGGTSGGTYASEPNGGRWTIGTARLDAAFAPTSGAVAFSTREDEHEIPYTVQRTHTALDATVHANHTRMLEVLVPSAAAAAAPAIVNRGRPGLSAFTATTADGLRLDAALANGGVPISDHPAGGPAIDTDGSYVATVTDASGVVSLVATGASYVRIDGALAVTTATRGLLTLHRGARGFEFGTDAAAPAIAPATVGNAAAAIDGACGVTVGPAGIAPALLPGRRTVRFHASGNAAPAADAGPDRRATVGTDVALAGAACDFDHDALTWRWQLVAAPPGSRWKFTGTNGSTPTLLADRPGTYRVRLTVTDRHGATGAPSEVVVAAGARAGDGIDNDLDGLIDSDDADLDGADPTDAAAIIVAGTTPDTRIGTTTPDRLAIEWQPGDSSAALPRRVRGDVPIDFTTRVALDLTRAGDGFTGVVTLNDRALGAGRIAVPGSQWSVFRFGSRVLILRATVRAQPVTLVLGDATRTTVIGPARG